jgi:hypothetical protein
MGFWGSFHGDPNVGAGSPKPQLIMHCLQHELGRTLQEYTRSNQPTAGNVWRNIFWVSFEIIAQVAIMGRKI